MAFDELGIDPSRRTSTDYTVSATGLVSRTINLWRRHLIQYIIIVGMVGVVIIIGSLLILFAVFGTIGVIAADPFSYIFNIFSYSSISNLTLFAVSFLFAILAFVVNALVGGAAIKFALDDYNERKGDIRTSFSHARGKLVNFVSVQLVISSLVSVLYLPGLIIFTDVLNRIDITDPYDPIIPPGTMELVMIGFVVLLAGLLIMIYISARLTPTVAIVIDTDLSVIDSLKKSWTITNGNVLHVIGGRILFGIVVGVLGLVVSAFTYPLTIYGFLPSSFSVVIESILIALLFSALNYIFPVVLYRDLNSRVKESSLEELMV